MNERRPMVAIIGGNQCTQAQAEWAEEVGRGLATAGIDIICGGRRGVMEAACKGAFEVGGRTIGILPGITDGDANPYLTVVIPTGLGEARNMVVAIAGEVVIAIAGSFGTLSEIAFALKRSKVVIGLNTWEASTPNGVEASILRASNADEAVTMAITAIEQARKTYG